MTLNNYKIGIDVGLYSTGLAAIEVDSNGEPVRILNMQSVIHDGGVDPNSNKTADTRKMISGVARRTRRMRRRRKSRLANLNKYLEELRLPLENYGDDTFEPWMLRARLADGYIQDEEQRKYMLSVAFRHIARHRGWRNPYKSVKSLYNVNLDDLSERYDDLCEACQVNPEDGLTPAQIIGDYLASKDGQVAPRIRHSGSKSEAFAPLPQKLMQEDNAYEVRYICEQQGVDDETCRKLIDKIFYAVSPRGSASERVALDDLTHEKRATKASLAFQKFRIIAALSFLKLAVGGQQRPLTVEEKNTAFDILSSMDSKTRPTWADVAAALGVNRRDIKGIGGIQDDGDRISNRAPVMDSYFALIESSGVLGKLVKHDIMPWWRDASEDDQERLLELLGNNVDIDSIRDDMSYSNAFELIDSFDDDQLGAIDNIKLPAGRAAYSVSACQALTVRMLSTTDNLHDARKTVYGVTDNWKPAQEPIGFPIGNPSADRVLKIVNRYLMNCTARWGTPVSVNIEHAREGFSSAKVARAYQKDAEAYATNRSAIFDKIKDLYPDFNRFSDSAMKRWEAIQRQNGECLYCGATLKFTTCELDHIVPRKGVGATNTKTNLAAVCTDCNRAKSKKLFSLWCHDQYAVSKGITVAKAVARVEMFTFPAGTLSAANAKRFKEAVKSRLTQMTEDEAPDNRSIESVSWMADELHKRIDWYYNSQRYTATSDIPERAVKVFVYSGLSTSLARRFSGIEKQIHFAGPSGKTRLDRRHHAVDAAVIALMQHNVAEVLVDKNELYKAQRYSQKEDGADWREYRGKDEEQQFLYGRWLGNIHVLLDLINDALDDDRVQILRNLRLELGNSRAHEDTIHKLLRVRLGDRIEASLVQRASTPALFTTLTRCDDFDEKTGLPENRERHIVVNGVHYGSEDEIAFFEKNAAQIMVHNGSAEIGNGFHHARIYLCDKINKSGKKTGEFYGMIRVFAADLAKSRNDDLLTVPLSESSLSMRYGDPSTVKAIREGHARFVGHLFVGDELRLDLSQMDYTGQVKEFADFLQPWCSAKLYATWTVDGYFSPSQLRLRPSYLSAEGLEKLDMPISDDIQKIFTRGWLPSINAVSAFHPTVVRRNGLGEIRWKSNAGLPVSYRWHE